MSKELPYIDEQGQLHYEAYFGNGRAFLRSALPTSHPEHLFNYLTRHGIDWKLYFEDDGRRKGIDHEHGPVEKLLGLDKKIGPLADVFGKFPGKERVEYTRSDMERAFVAGALAMKDHKEEDRKPPVKFDKWLERYEKEQAFQRQAEGRMHRKGQGTKIEIVDITTNSETVEEMFKGVAPIINVGKHFIHEILAEVVMLPGKSPSHIYELNGKLHFEEYPDKKVNAGNRHLYFLSSDEIVEGDEGGYVFCHNTIQKITKVHPFDGIQVEPGVPTSVGGKPEWYTIAKTQCKKIIATTDHSLRMNDNSKVVGFPYEFPSPTERFLFIYIGCYNTGNPVKRVAIEAENICDETCPDKPSHIDECRGQPNLKLLIDKNNTINIIAK